MGASIKYFEDGEEITLEMVRNLIEKIEGVKEDREKIDHLLLDDDFNKLSEVNFTIEPVREKSNCNSEIIIGWGFTMDIPRIILGVPGYWKTRDEFKEAMARKGNGYIYAGNHIGSLENPGEFFKVEINEYNSYVAEAFEIAGNGSFNQEDINNIKNHHSIVYIIGEGGSLEKVLNIMEVASAVLHAGGIAVNVESSGRASTKEDWLEAASSKEITRVFSAFIQMAREYNTFYTSGMQCFGYPDVLTTSEDITGIEVETLFRVFCIYNLIERPKITSGETFSLDSDSPIYLLRQESCTIFEEDDLFYNPYGMWNLVSHQ